MVQNGGPFRRKLGRLEEMKGRLDEMVGRRVEIMEISNALFDDTSTSLFSMDSPSHTTSS